MHPHCDQAVLHAPGECVYCDKHPEWQDVRLMWGIAFTGHEPVADEVACPSDMRRGVGGAHDWDGNRPAAVSHLDDERLRVPRDEHDQQLPDPVDGPDIHELVADDLFGRRELGVRRYGQPLRAFNGRDPLLDAYQEALDLSVYLKQALQERSTMENE